MHRKKCLICDSPFKTDYSSQIYCSRKCRDRAAWEKKHKGKKVYYRKCVICDNSFNTIRPYQKYCWRDSCKVEFNREDDDTRYPKKCAFCGNLFEAHHGNTKYCSVECVNEIAKQYSSCRKVKQKLKSLITYKCAICGKTFDNNSRRRKYCSEKCLRESLRPTSNILKWKVLNRDNFRCQYCGKTPQDGIGLVLDHITPEAKGGLTTLDNLVTACMECNSYKIDNLLDHEAEFKLRIRKRIDFAISQGYFSFLTEAKLN